MSALTLALSACTTLVEPPADNAAVDVPLAWSTQSSLNPISGQSLAQWWQQFEDPLLTDLIARAMLANTQVGTAQAAWRQARALRDVAAAALIPIVDVGASASRNAQQHNTTTSVQAGLDGTWALDVFGVNRSALNATEASALYSEASLGDVQVGIAAEVALAYILLRGTQARLAIANDNLASQQETQQITSWRQQAGLITLLEAEQARALAEQTAASLPLLQMAIDQNMHALAVLIGRPPGELMMVLLPLGPVPQMRQTATLSFPAETLRQRADVRSAEYQVMAAQARVKQAQAARLPSFSIGGSLGLDALTLGTLASGASVVSALLASVRLPVLDGGAATAQIGVQRAALDQTQQAYRAAILLALREVEDALVALRDDRYRLTHLSRAADAAAQAALMARQRYSSGLVDFQIVLETQRTRLGVQDALAIATTTISSDHVRLYKAIGGGWNSTLHREPPP